MIWIKIESFRHFEIRDLGEYLGVLQCNLL